MIVYEKIIMGTPPKKFPYNLGSAVRRLMFTINMQNSCRREILNKVIVKCT